MKVNAFARKRWLLVPLGVLLVGALVAAHYGSLTAPARYADRDFMSLWSGGRAILEGLDPYDPGVWVPLRSRFGSTWMPDDRAPFPLWTLMLLVPLAILPLDWAAAAWLVLGELLLGLSVFLLAVQVGGQRLSAAAFAALALGALVSRGALITLNNGQITFLLLLALTAFLVLSRRRKPFAAGFVLAFVALKPSPFVLFAPLIGLWLIARRRWKVVLGSLAGGAVLLAASWLVQPGWLFKWLNVRGKTEATFQTPTIWGIAHELSSAWWPLIGMAMAVLLAGGLGWLLLARQGAGRVATGTGRMSPAPTGEGEMDEAHAVSLALIGSLLVTPYAWAYEHVLLLIPLLLLFARLVVDKLTVRPGPRHLVANMCAWLIWIALVFCLPWLLYWVAVRLDRDTMSFLVPALVGVAFYVLCVRGADQWCVHSQAARSF